MAVHVHQIFYNEETREKLDAGFIALDNTANLRPDWFEFHVMHQYMLHHDLNENDWYGFFSPNFKTKTGLDSTQVNEMVAFAEKGGANVTLIPFAWEQVAYFQNPIEQGEFAHKGLGNLCRRVFDTLGFASDVENWVMHRGNFSFSNFIVAKPAYWRQWLVLANAFFELAEAKYLSLSKALREPATYVSKTSSDVQLKVFVQERLPFLILKDNQFVCSSFDLSAYAPLLETLFVDTPTTRERLQQCNALKHEHVANSNLEALKQYKAARDSITLVSHD